MENARKKRHGGLTEAEIEELFENDEFWEESEDGLDNSDDENDLESLFDIDNLPIDILENDVLEGTSFIDENNENGQNEHEVQITENKAQNEESHRKGNPLGPSENQNKQQKITHIIWRKKNLLISDNCLTFEERNYPSNIMDLETPFQCFRYFLTDECLDLITFQSNLYANQTNINKNSSLTKTDIDKFIGISLYCSLMTAPSTRTYWSQHLGYERINNCMSYNNYQTIKRFLHFNDNEKMPRKDAENFDRLYKLRPFINSLNERFSTVPFERDLAVDEQLCSTKVRSYLKQYLPNKPNKWGFKLFVISGVSGYVYNFEIYSGQENATKFRLPEEPDLGATGNTVLRLIRNVPRHKNHRIYFDNYYTSLNLTVYLAKQGILSLGTVRRNRLPNCKLPTDSDLKTSIRGTSHEYVGTVDNIEITSVAWKDNKVVNFLSNYCGVLPKDYIQRFDGKEKKKILIECPAVVKQYNKHMGGVDLMDSFIARCKIKLKSKKWYIRLFYHLLDMVVANSWILHKKICEKKSIISNYTLPDFKAEIAYCLTQQFIKTTRGRPSNNLENEIAQKKKRGPAAYVPPKDIRCDQTGHWPVHLENKQRCKYPTCKGFSSIKCNKCGVGLCLNRINNCFFKFHNEY